MANKKSQPIVRWAPAEDQVIKKHVADSPTLTKAYEMASRELVNRNPHAIGQRHNKIKKAEIKPSVQPRSSEKSKVQNKVSTNGNSEVLETILYLSSKLQPGERKQIVQALF